MMRRTPRPLSLIVWSALYLAAGFWVWMAVLSAQQADWGSVAMIVVAIYLTIAPPRYDPAMRIGRRLGRR